MAAKDDLGRYGEDVVARALVERGWVILRRNWRCARGEIDIVALDGEDLVFVEVKTRTSHACGTPAEAVTPAKVARLRRLAAAWLAEHPHEFSAVRIDVAAVEVRPPYAPSVELLGGVA